MSLILYGVNNLDFTYFKISLNVNLLNKFERMEFNVLGPKEKNVWFHVTGC